MAAKVHTLLERGWGFLNMRARRSRRGNTDFRSGGLNRRDRKERRGQPTTQAKWRKAFTEANEGNEEFSGWRHAAGTERRCWVNPDAREQAVLTRQLGADLWIGFVPWAFVAAGSLGMIQGVRHGHARSAKAGQLC